VPVHRDGRTLGFVATDDPPPGDHGAESFLVAIANMLAPRLSRSLAPREAPAVPAIAAAAAREPFARAALAALPVEELEAEVHPGVSVLVLRFGDPLALARRAEGGAPVSLIERVATELQSAAREHALDYLKLMGESAVAAAGLRPEERGEPALARLARFALSLRSCCLGEFEAANQVVDFRLGLHIGVAIGNAVGEQPRIFNLWGDAVRTAEQMAASAPPGAIQTTEAVQQMLRASFLFRPRGAFWLPRLGEMPTFLLVRAL
jgi:class 3 adenylate cyclase